LDDKIQLTTTAHYLRNDYNETKNKNRVSNRWNYLFAEFVFGSIIPLCGFFILLIASGLSANLAVKQENPNDNIEGAKIGLIAGGMTSSLALIGLMTGNMLVFKLISMISTGIRFEYHPIFIGIYFVIVLVLAMAISGWVGYKASETKFHVNSQTDG
jgi:hypothetical protein